MSFKTFDIEAPLAGRLGEALGTGVQTGFENLQKRLLEQQKTASKKKESILKERSKLNSALSSLQKTYEREGLLSDEDKDLLKEQAQALIQEGYPAELALDTVFKSYRDQQTQQPLTSQQLAEQEQLPPGLNQGIFPAFLDRITKGSPQSIEERQKLFEKGPSLIREPMSFLRGATESPLANLMASLSDPLATALRTQQEGPRAFIQPPVQTSVPADETTKQKRTREFGKELTTAVLTGTGPLGSLLGEATGGILKGVQRLVGKLKPRDLNIINRSVREAAKKAGISETEAASNMVSELENRGLLSRAKPNPKDTKEILKTARTFQEEGIFPVKEAQKEIQEQLRLGKQKAVGEEVEREVGRRSARKPSKGEVSVKETAEKSLPRSRKNYFNATKTRRNIEDSIRLKEGKYNQSDLALARSNEEFHLRNVKKNQYEALTGKKYNTKWSNEQAAFKTVQEVQKISRDFGKDISDELKLIRSRGYQFKDPELIKQANEALRKPLKGRVSENQFVKINEDYANTFLKRLKNIDKEIKSLSNEKSMVSIQQMKALQREREMLTELLKDSQKKVALGQRREVLKQIDERLQTQKKLLGSEYRGFENLTEEELNTLGLAKENLKNLENTFTNFVEEIESAAQKGRSSTGDVADAIKETNRLTNKNKKSLHWLNINPSYWIQQGIKKSTGFTIPRNTIRAALTLTGLGGSASAPSLINRIKRTTRVSRFADYVRRKDMKGAQEYRRKLIQSGVSPTTVNKYQKLGRETAQKAA